MILRTFLPLAVAGMALAACASTPTPSTPAQSVYALESGLTAAIEVATDYANLPRCSGATLTDSAGSSTAVSEVLCSDPATVKEIDAAAQTATTAVTAAQAAVTSGAASSQAQAAAVQQATTALSSLTALTSKVQTK